jgi:CxxC-x17-CxxC domain-containing protein
VSLPIGAVVDDKTIACKDCGMSFIFSVRDQQFYAEKGFENEPQRCRDCRSARKTQRAATAGAREMFEAVCAQCGVATTVPFKPRGDRPVYCRTCFANSMAPMRA